MRLKDKVAIVTGSTSGIGRATAELFARQGARVLVTGRNRSEGEEVVAGLAGAPGEAAFFAADLGAPNGPDAVVQAAIERWQRVDILINNAAMMTFDRIDCLSLEDWDRVLNVNLRAPFQLARAVLPHMRDGGAIVNISSVHAAETMAGVVPYAASKGGLEAFTRGLAVELRERDIRVNVARLGAVDTPMLWNNPNVKAGREVIDPKDVGAPEDVAEAVLFLAGVESAFITGAILNVDGGRLAAL
jgi:glucose 1-dehydrogenase